MGDKSVTYVKGISRSEPKCVVVLRPSGVRAAATPSRIAANVDRYDSHSTRLATFLPDAASVSKRVGHHDWLIKRPNTDLSSE